MNENELKERRSKIENLVLDCVKMLDNNKMNNYNYYKGLFNSMNDTEFSKWAGSMGHELDDTIQLIELPFEEVHMSQVKKCADYLDIPLEEYITYHHIPYAPNGVRSKSKVPVGYVHIKRMQQLLSKKNSYGLDIDSVELKSGQVKGTSKVASLTDPETFSLAAISADKSLEELLGPRADNQFKKQRMYQMITRDGYVTLDELKDDKKKHYSTTLSTIDTYMIASGLHTDLRTNSLKTPYTVDQDTNNK